jgi:uncharacterized membrane protein
MTAYQPVLDRTRLAGDDARSGRFFLLVAPLLYLAYALLTPPFQNFDENQHLYRAWQISSFQFVGERRGRQSGGELPPGLATATLQQIGSVVPQGERHVTRRPIYEIFGVNTPIGSGRKPIYYDFFGSVVYSPAGYVPQVIAVRTGETAHFSVEWTLRLGRVLNLALCIALVWWALRIMPFGRWLMVTIALSPPMAAGATSFGQDALVNGGAFLLTAMGLKVAVERRWTVSRAAVVGTVGAVISVAKFVYLPLLSIAALPVPERVGIPRWLLPPLLIGLVAAALLCAWIRITAGAVVDPFRPWVPTFPEQVSWAITHPIDFSALIARTWLVWLPSMWARLYDFGDSTVPTIWAAAVPGTAAIVTMMIYGDHKAVDLNRGRRIWMLLIVAAVTFLVTVAMFLTLAPRGSITIEGIQARYFLPALPLGAIALMRRCETESRLFLPLAFTLLSIAHALTLGTIITTFYSF